MRNFDFDHIDIPEEDYLYVGKSGIEGAGDGLFTCIDIYKNEIISVYKGKLISYAEADRRKISGDDKFLMKMPGGRLFDTSDTPCYAKYANDFLDNKSALISMEGRSVVLIAKRKIKSGSEIFTSYGDSYWKGRRRR